MLSNGRLNHSHVWVAQLVVCFDVLGNLMWISPLLLIGDGSKIETHIKNHSRCSSSARRSAVNVDLLTLFIDALVKLNGCFHDALCELLLSLVVNWYVVECVDSFLPVLWL